MRILINKQNNDKFKFKQLCLLQSGIIPLRLDSCSIVDSSSLDVESLFYQMKYHYGFPYLKWYFLRVSSVISMFISDMLFCCTDVYIGVS